MNESLSLTAVTVLNELLKLDSKACNELVDFNTGCNESLVDSADIQTQAARGGKHQIGVVRLLNSILLKHGEAKVAMIMDAGVVVGFTEYKPSKK